MRALDTPILIRLLRGDRSLDDWLGSLRGLDLVTTEWNLLELEAISRADPRPGRERRRTALDLLRRRVSVLPVDEGAYRSAHEVRGVPRSPEEMVLFGILATLESRHCEILYTDRADAFGHVRAKVRVVSVH